MNNDGHMIGDNLLEAIWLGMELLHHQTKL